MSSSEYNHNEVPGTQYRSPSDCPSVKALEFELAFLVRRLEAARRRFNFGLERAHYLLLILLEQRNQQSIGELADQVNLDASTITRQIAAMADNGLVEKTDNPNDRRAGFVSITDTGRAKAAEVRCARITSVEQCFGDWTEGERHEFARLTAKYNDAMRDMLNNV